MDTASPDAKEPAVKKLKPDGLNEQLEHFRLALHASVAGRQTCK